MSQVMQRSRSRVIAFAVALSLAALLSQAAAASAAPSAGWKVLAVTGPTNLPPTQSEIQRVTVEATGGTFTLSIPGAKGIGTPVVQEGHLNLTAGSTVATIESVGAGAAFEVGYRIVGPGLPSDTTVVSCSPDCSSAGSSVTLSHEASLTESNAAVEIFTKELKEVSGGFQVGNEVQGSFFEYFPPGTVVTAVGPETLTLSAPTTHEYLSFEGAIAISASNQKTAPTPFNAAPGVLQANLEALSLGPGSVAVSGGPGGDATRPYFVEFVGPLENQNAPSLTPDGSGLFGEHPSVHVFTIVPGGAGTGEIMIAPTNVGGAPSSGKIVVTLGPLPPGIVSSGPAVESVGGEGAWTCPGFGGESTIECTSEFPMASMNVTPGIKVPVKVSPNAPLVSSVPVTISGGGGHSASYEMPIVVSKAQAGFGTQAFWAGAFDAEGNLETQAGAHPAGAATEFFLNTVRSVSGAIVPAADPKDFDVDLPPGFLGNPMVTPRCPQRQLSNPYFIGSGPLCGNNMVIGRFNAALSAFGETAPSLGQKVYNDVPANGVAAEFTSIIGSPEVSIFANVRSSEDFGVRVSSLNIPTYAKVYGGFAALDGSPAGAVGRAFLTNSGACAEEARRAPIAVGSADTWQNPGAFSSPAVQVVPPVVGCDKLEFTPSLAIQPSTTTGSSGTGATAHLHISQTNLLDPSKLAQPSLKKAVVTLPPGLNVNAASAKGLEACSEEQIGYIGVGDLPNPTRFNEEPPACPDGSKLGTVDVSTPLLEEELHGTIYLAEQEKNPFGSLIALYLAIDSQRFGLHIKLPGKVEPDPKTGQLTATFDNNPQVPFEDLTLHFRGGGPRSELATPEVCGNYKTTGDLTPWSAPESGPPAQIQEAGFDVSSGCASSADKRPFAPTFEAGTKDTQAGAYSPLVIKINRNDGEQELKSLEFTLPKGVSGKLAGIEYCSEDSINAARGKTGKAEQASPSCPAKSEMGTVDAAAGVGSEPFHVGGHVYLAGPYEGAPLSSVVITPAVAGPFDLGNVVVRAPLFLNLETAQITAKSEDLPTILRGIPLKVRSVTIDLSRKDFTLDPTSCEVMYSSAKIGSSDGATASPTSRFQVGGCNKLKYKPKLKLSLKGATKRSGHPALKAVVTAPQGAYANTARVQVGLPHSEFLDQGNLDKVCTQPELKSNTCPARSVYGHVKVWTPITEKPLEGNVYIGVGYGHKLPALVAELNGQIRILLKPDHGNSRQGHIDFSDSSCKKSWSHSFCSRVLDSLHFKLEKSTSPSPRPARSTAAATRPAPASTPAPTATASRKKGARNSGVGLRGATRRGGHPALRAVVTMKPGEANIARAQVNLPHSEFLDQGSLNRTCTRPVLLAGACPASTVYGKARAWTPLLEKPLEGNVYLVGGFGFKLPALVAELNGQIKVLLVGKIDSGKNHGIRTTFEGVPDAPVSRFELSMRGGKKYGLLENSEDLCKASKAKRRAIVRFTGQNGKVDAYKPVVANQCAKAKRHKKKHRAHRAKAKGGGGKTSALLQRLSGW